MSLTSHLDNSNSPVRRFFSGQFPNTRAVTRECSRTLSQATTIRPNKGVPYGTLGTAIDYRARFYFPATPIKDLVAWHGALKLNDELMSQVIREAMDDETITVGSPDGLKLPLETIEGFFLHLENVLQRLRPSGRRLERSQEEDLVRCCVVLALFEEVFRAGPHPNSPLFRFGPAITLQELLSIADPLWIDDLCSMSLLFYEQFREVLSHPVTLNPVFAGSSDVGGADADLILDGCLIDIKATVNPRVTNLWLYQLLGYVFLDYNNQYQIHEVGLYLARQGVLFRWALPGLLDQLAATAIPPLEELRERFRQTVQTVS